MEIELILLVELELVDRGISTPSISNSSKLGSTTFVICNLASVKSWFKSIGSACVFENNETASSPGV